MTVPQNRDNAAALVAAQEKIGELEFQLQLLRDDADRRLNEADSLLEGARVLSQALDSAESFARISEVLRRIFHFDHAFVLIETADGTLQTIAATHPAFADRLWHPREAFRRVLGGEPMAVFDIAFVPEWQAQSLPLPVVSALHIPLDSGIERAILICTHHARGAFSQSEVSVARRFAPLAAQAVRTAQLLSALRKERDQLEERVASRTVELTEQRDFAFQVLNTMGQGLTVVDSRGVFIYVNPAFARFLGYPADQIIGRTPFDFTLDGDHDVLSSARVERQDGAVTTYETRLKRRDGTLTTVLVTGVPRLRSGRRDGSISVVTNLDQQKQTEEALRRSEAEARKLSQVASRTDNIVIITDALGQIEWVNDAFTRITGYTPEEALGRRPGSLLQGPDTDPETVAFMSHAVRERQSFSCEVLNYAKSGRPYWVAVEVQPVYDQSGELTHFIAIEADITERRRFELALRESEERLRLVLETALDAVIGIDSAGRVTYWNQQAARTFGWTEAEVAGRNFSDLVLLPRQTDRADTTIVPGDHTSFMLNQRIELEAVHRDGYRFPVEVAITPVRVGDAESFSAFVRNITNRKAYEAALQRAREAAESADRAKTHFLANMSHEIRTPMNAVIGFSSLLLDMALSAEQRDYVDAIRTSGENLLTILNDILDFSKIEAGYMAIDPIPFSVSRLVEESLDLFAVTAGHKQLDLVSRIGENVAPLVEADPNRLRQILVNLVGNAIKFTERGEVVVTVDAEPVAPDRQRLIFSVRDSGIGIAPDRIEQLFQPFRQLDPSTTRKYGGTGLGLAISRRLCELMGGKITMESAPGYGTSVTVELPVTIPDLPATAPAWQGATALSGYRALVVDDSRAAVEAVTRHLARCGMSVVAAATAEEAVVLLREADLPFDVLLLDAHLPDAHLPGVAEGQTVAAYLHREAGNGLPPIVLLAAAGRRESADWSAWKTVTLATPIKPHLLYNALLTLLGHPASIPPVAPHDPAPHTIPSNVTMGSRHPLRIVLAEDNPVNRKVMGRMLERLGYGATVVSNGLELLDALEQQFFDVVLMDIQMPEMDGITATREIIARWPAGQRPRIIAVTAHALEGDRDFCLNAGMDDYLSKPTGLEALAAALSRVPAGAPEPSAPVVATAEAASGQPFPQADSPLINYAVLVEQFGPEFEAFLAELLPVYFEETAPLIAGLHDAIGRNDAEAIRQAAHAIKGASAIMGLTALAECAAGIEQLARQGQLSPLPAAATRLTHLFGQSRQLIPLPTA
jgi:PAS domain S-box-containing protein